MQTPKHLQNQQQGFVLALALLLMLFIGVIVISSAQRTGTETRVAQSEVPIASLQAAAEAGVFYFQERVRSVLTEKQDKDGSFTKGEDACSFIEVDKSAETDLPVFLGFDADGKGEGIGGNARIFTEEKGLKVYWYLDPEYDCADAVIEIKSVSFAGSHSQKISRLELSATMKFENKNPFNPDDYKEIMDIIGENGVYAGGAVAKNPASNIVGLVENAGSHTTPSPGDKHPSDETGTGFVSTIKQMLADGDKRVVESCNGTNLGDAEYVYCEGDFDADVNSNLEGRTIVVNGSIGASSALNVRSDVSVNFVATNTIAFKGFGNNEINGLIWSGSNVSFGGRSNVVGGVIANGTVAFNGRTEIEATKDFEIPFYGNSRYSPSTTIKFDY